MQFDELCALVGALRDRVADLETKEAARAERDARTIEIRSDPVRDWRTLDGKPICAGSPKISLDLTGSDGSPDIAAIAEKAAASGVAQVLRALRADGGQAAPGLCQIGESGPETFEPTDRPAFDGPGVRLGGVWIPVTPDNFD